MNLTAKQQLSRNPSNAGYATPLKTYSIPATSNEDGTINVPAQPVYGIDPNHEPIDCYMATRNYAPGVIPVPVSAPAGTYYSGTLNGATGRTRTVPVGHAWELLSVVIQVGASATVGNRVLNLSISDSNQYIWVGPNSAAVTAGQFAGYDVAFGSPATSNTTVRKRIDAVTSVNVQVTASAPRMLLPAGANLIVVDTAGIDVADTLSFVVYVIDYTL